MFDLVFEILYDYEIFGRPTYHNMIDLGNMRVNTLNKWKEI